MARPLHELAKKGQKFEWTERQEAAFIELKGLTSFLVPVAGASQLAPVNWRVCHATGT